MEYFWEIFASAVFFLIVYSIISSNVRQRRLKRATEAMLPSLKQHFQTGRRYNVFVSHGQLFERVLFVGISEPFGAKYSPLPFPLTQWIILERESGQRLYIKPESIRYYEDVEGPQDV